MTKKITLNEQTVKALEEYREVYEKWHKLMYGKESTGKEDDSFLIRRAILDSIDNLKKNISFYEENNDVRKEG